jgi:hypothetical protein
MFPRLLSCFDYHIPNYEFSTSAISFVAGRKPKNESKYIQHRNDERRCFYSFRYSTEVLAKAFE